MTTRRAKPVAAKAGVTKDPKRRYGEGGKITKGKKYKCGGKLR
jgi:hypothetical protein